MFELNLSNTSVTDMSTVNISKDIRILNLLGTGVTDEAVARIKTDPERCVIVEF